MNIPKTIDDYEILKLEKETEKALFYSCNDKTGKQCLIKFYKKNKKLHLNSLTDIHIVNAIEILKESKIFDTETSKYFDYEIMPFLENVTRLSEQTPLSENEAFEIIKKIAECLNEFHKNGFVHRNITPENILMNDNEPILISYGCVTEIDLQDDVDVSLTQIFKDKEDVTGTEGFIALEVYTGVISPAVDYYCLGMTLYYLLTGKSLYEECKAEKYKILLFLGKLNDVVNKNPVLSVKQKRLICGLITLQHDKRWGYDEISRFLNGEDVQVYTDWNPPEPFVFGFKKYFDVQLLSETFLKHSILGTRVIKNGRFTKYLLRLGLTGRANQIDKLIKDNGKNCSAKEICSLVYLVMNDMKYNLCANKKLKIKEDLYSLSEQLQKRVEFLVLSKDVLFDLWLTGIFDVNMKEFYSVLEGDEDYAKSLAINKLRHEKGLWPLLVEFLDNKKINVKAEPLDDNFFKTTINDIVKISHCNEVIKNENVLLAGKNGKYKAYNLIENKPIFHTKIFIERWAIPDGYILKTNKNTEYLIQQRGRKSFIHSLAYKELSKTVNTYLQNQDFQNLNKFISLVFEYKHLKREDADFERTVLSFINKNHIEGLTPLAQFYYFYFLYSQDEINTSTLIKKMTETCNSLIKAPVYNSYLLLNEMGTIYYKMEMKKEAMLCYEKGMNCDFDKTMINEIAIASLYSEERKYNDGLSYFNLCKKDKPELIYENPDVYKYYQDCVTALGLKA